jgi:putative peptide zinc metalloprotease protein
MNLSVRELELLRPRLRDGLNFTVQEQGCERVCVNEDPSSSQFFRVGLEEYQFFRSLDGTQTVAAIIARLARDRSGETFTEYEALQMLRWLKDHHLLAVESDRATGKGEESQRAWAGAVKWMNPLIVRIPLAQPDRLFAMLARALKPFLGWFGFFAWLCVVIAGGSQIAVEWGRFTRGFNGIIARDNWLWLGLVWVGLKVLHEFGHGIYCRHFGARVREIGVIFILFMPMGYVDAAASLGLPSRWRRIAVACAGMYVEFFVAAIAAIVWASRPDGAAATVLHNVVVMGTVVTLFFNANPLMRFDGYFVLSDLLGIPNLAPRGRTWFTRAVSWLLTGVRKLRPERPASREEWIIALYGIAAWVWQNVAFVGMLVAASVMFRGGGIAFAVVAAVAWMVPAVAAFVRQAGGHMRGGMGAMADIALRFALIAALIGMVLFVPYRKTVVARGVVEFGDTRIVRAECPGFVGRIHVRDGDVVAQGALLMELRNEEVASAIEKSRRELEAQEVRTRIAYARRDVAEYQAEMAKVDGLQKAMKENESYAGTLKVRAPIAGRVSSRTLKQALGAYIQRGEEILKIGEATGRDVRLALGQDAEPHFKAALHRRVSVRIEGRGGTFSARLERLDGNASRTLPHAALTALAGGPLAVQRVQDDAPSQTQSQGQLRHELTEPHFGATVRMLSASASDLADGELARVRFQSPEKVTLWGELRGAIARWMRKYGA